MAAVVAAAWLFVVVVVVGLVPIHTLLLWHNRSSTHKMHSNYLSPRRYGGTLCTVYRIYKNYKITVHKWIKYCIEY